MAKSSLLACQCGKVWTADGHQLYAGCANGYRYTIEEMNHMRPSGQPCPACIKKALDTKYPDSTK